MTHVNDITLKRGLCSVCGGPCCRRSTRCITCANKQRHDPIRESIQPPNPSGTCACGCGRTTPIAPVTKVSAGWLRGHHIPCCRGHRPRNTVEWIVDSITGCWNWQGPINGTGYGMFIYQKTRQLAHRAVYERFNGPIPPNHELHHQCENRKCVNPNHLEPLTRTGHIRADRSKLTVDDVYAIRESTERDQVLAARYGVTFQAIRAVRRRQIWADV